MSVHGIFENLRMLNLGESVEGLWFRATVTDPKKLGVNMAPNSKVYFKINDGNVSVFGGSWNWGPARFISVDEAKSCLKSDRNPDGSVVKLSAKEVAKIEDDFQHYINK